MESECCECVTGSFGAGNATGRWLFGWGNRMAGLSVLVVRVVRALWSETAAVSLQASKPDSVCVDTSEARTERSDRATRDADSGCLGADCHAEFSAHLG